MDTAFDILQALGIGAAVGIRPFLPALLVGALASADLGIDFDGTDFAFLEEPAFLLAMLVGVAILITITRRGGPEALESGPGFVAVVVAGVAIAALLGMGSLADHGGPVVAGAVAGVAAAALAIVTMRPLFIRVRSRLDKDAAGMLALWRLAAALAIAGLSVLLPPLAALVILALVFLLFGGQRREGEKYAGLRILR